MTDDLYLITLAAAIAAASSAAAQAQPQPVYRLPVLRTQTGPLMTQGGAEAAAPPAVAPSPEEKKKKVDIRVKRDGQGKIESAQGKIE